MMFVRRPANAALLYLSHTKIKKYIFFKVMLKDIGQLLLLLLLLLS